MNTRRADPPSRAGSEGRRRRSPRQARAWGYWLLSLSAVSGSALTHAQEIAPPSTDPVTADTSATAAPVEAPTLLLVVGAPGSDEYTEIFTTASQAWRDAASRGGAELLEPATDDDTTDRAWLEAKLASLPAESQLPLWIVVLGHGTFDGTAAKLNLDGPDVTDLELATWLERFDRPIAIILACSSSGPFLARLAKPGRAVVTATRSGFEFSYSRFGEAISSAWADPAADLDKDEQVSLLEAFLFASKRTAEFYDREGRLATEHALLDDDGDGLGTPSDWYRGVRAVQKSAEGRVDGVRAHQLTLIPSDRERALPLAFRQQRNALERQLADLRNRREDFEEPDYLDRLEVLLVDLADLYAELEPEIETEGEGETESEGAAR